MVSTTVLMGWALEVSFPNSLKFSLPFRSQVIRQGNQPICHQQIGAKVWTTKVLNTSIICRAYSILAALIGKESAALCYLCRRDGRYSLVQTVQTTKELCTTVINSQ